MNETLARHRCVGSMGSEFWRIEVPPEIVPALAAEFDWNRMGRRVMIDAAKGIISWMNPSSAHATFADAADKTVERAARLLGGRARAMRGTRWKGPEDPRNTGLEADAELLRRSERRALARGAGRGRRGGGGGLRGGDAARPGGRGRGDPLRRR